MCHPLRTANEAAFKVDVLNIPVCCDCECVLARIAEAAFEARTALSVSTLDS